MSLQVAVDHEHLVAAWMRTRSLSHLLMMLFDVLLKIQPVRKLVTYTVNGRAYSQSGFIHSWVVSCRRRLLCRSGLKGVLLSYYLLLVLLSYVTYSLSNCRLDDLHLCINNNIWILILYMFLLHGMSVKSIFTSWWYIKVKGFLLPQLLLFVQLQSIHLLSNSKMLQILTFKPSGALYTAVQPWYGHL